MSVADVSFVVPVYNGERYLAECLDSILSQTVVPREVIVVDDGSTDGSVGIAQSFGEPVRCLRQPHSGVGSARNRGVAAARGDLIAFLDADDLAVPHRLEVQLARFSANPALEFCDAYSQNFWSSEIPVDARAIAPRERFTHGEVPKAALIITWLVKRALFERLGGFDEGLTMGEDAEWRDRMNRASVAAETVDDVLAMRRLHSDNLTRRNYDEYLRHVVRRCKDRMTVARNGNDGR
jgi:glycosyltransferase involved in cell wall biosynthesis